MTRLAAALLILFSPLFAAGQGLTPEQSVQAMKLPDGFSVQCVAHEPTIRQPVSISFDDRGRMWVLQYLQYPNYEGLKPVKQDQYLRTIWDKFPEPPPKGPKGADKITILWDVGEDGKYRKSKDFVTGLNIASGFCLGNGGVYVAQPPYLLFYPDKDRDDIPDGNPEVLLTGFGMDDTHSLANSLQWGPDGWLYGAAGSTSTCKIKNPANPSEVIEFQQGVWRYHPQTKRFELFSEGGGNTYGLDFDRFGRCITGTNWGGKAMLHQMQGAYYVKGFSKHGPLHNPHAYGYFDHVPYEGEFKGGHVTCGGIVYDADLFPTEYRHQYIAANLLSNAVYMHTMTEKGSSFTAKHGSDLLVSSDPWFRPVDCLLGPDGCVYVVDFYDKRAAHLDPIDNWDKSNGRIYRISYKGAKPIPEMDLSKKKTDELLPLLKNSNKWWRAEARRILGERREGLEKKLVGSDYLGSENESTALESLWTWAACGGLRDGGLNSDRLLDLTRGPNQEHLRAWTIRLAVDDELDNGTVETLLKSAVQFHESPVAMTQLACSLRRNRSFAATKGTVDLMAYRERLPNDPQLPLLIWWAIDAKFNSDRSNLMTAMRSYAQVLLRDPTFETTVGERYLRRLTEAGEYAEVDFWLKSCADARRDDLALRAIDAGLAGKRLGSFPTEFELSKKYLQEANDGLKFRVALLLGVPGKYDQLVRRAKDSSLPEAEQNRWIATLAEFGDELAPLVFFDQFRTAKTDTRRLAVLKGFQRFSNGDTTQAILEQYPDLKGAVRDQAKQVMLTRPRSAIALLQQIDLGKLPKTELTPDQLRPLIEYKDQELTKLIEKHYGKIAAATPGEKQARISWLNIQIPKGKADLIKGKELFAKHCAVCHQLFGEGGKVGPDLTTADRKNRTYLLTHVVDPSLYIRPEYVSFNITTFDGRRLSGLVTDQGESMTLTNVINNVEQKVNLAKKDIEEIKPSAVSLMPEKLLDTISEDEIRDLFGYLQSDPKKEEKQQEPKATKKLKVLLISGSLEYESDKSLSLMQSYWEKRYPIECLRAFRKADNDLPGLEQLEQCDVAVFFTRRLTIDGEQLKMVKKYFASGKPVIGIRTASHGFQNYLEMDKEIFGGDYKNHHGNNLKCEIQVVEERKTHPILKGVESYIGHGSLYKNADIAKDCTVLITGGIEKFTYPVAWTREIHGRRIFYTSLGHQDDFKEDNFIKLLTNAVFWCVEKK